MNGLSNNTFHRGLFVEAESKIADRLPQPAFIVALVAALVIANLVFALSAASGGAQQPDLMVSAVGNDSSSHPLDGNATPRSTSGVLAEIPFDPLLP